MFKRRIGLVLVACLLLITLTGCNKNTKIAGRWNATFDMKVAGTAVTGTYIMTLNDDGSFAISQTASEKSRRTLINSYIEKYKAALDKKTDDELNTLMSQSGVSTVDDLAVKLLMKSAEDKGYTSVDAYVFAINGYEFKTIADGTYKFKGKKLTFFDSLGEKMNMSGSYGDEEITIKLNDKTVDFTPVELDK